MIEVGEAKKAANTVDCCEHRPFHDSFYLGIIHANAISVDEPSEVLDFHFVKRALFEASKEIVILELLKDLFHLGLMFSKRNFSEDHDVVNVDNDHILHVCK